MPNSVGQWIGPRVPVVMMLSIVITNHVVMGQRTYRKTATESSRFAAALIAELRAMFDMYEANLALIEQKAAYILSTRSITVIYKGNLGRLTMLLEQPAIELVVAVFAQNERIEAIIAAHSNLKCNLTYQLSSADIAYNEWKKMYQQASLRVMFACRTLEGCVGIPEPLTDKKPWYAMLDLLFTARNSKERRLSMGQ